MKKVLVGVIILLLLFVALIYLLIPSHVEIKTSSVIRVSPQAAVRILSRKETWKKWWPGSVANDSSTLRYGSTSYKIDQHLTNAFDIDILKTPDSVHSLLTLLPLHVDSLGVEWNGIANAGINPITRIDRYFEVKDTKNDMEQILASLKKFLEDQKNVYGIEIRREIVQDTLVVVKEKIVAEVPSTNSIYDIIEELRGHIKKQGARETNPPMVNVDRQPNFSFRLMVAIPVDHEIPSNGEIVFRRLVRGYILVADIQGGPATVAKGFEEMKNFITDYSRSQVAIPFESLVTERNIESDTTRWKTRIYFPIIH